MIYAIIAIVIVIILLIIISYVIASQLFKSTFERMNIEDDLSAFGNEKENIEQYIKRFKTEQYEDIYIEQDNLKLHGYFRDGKSDTLIIFVHGWHGEAIKDSSFVAPFLLDTNYKLLFIDLRAHGQSEGKYVGFGVLDHQDLLKWIDYINELYPDVKIILYGVSMGANTVLLASDKVPNNVRAIIADCGFTSAWDCFSYLCKQRKMIKFPVLNIMEMICKHRAGYGFRKYSTVDTVKNARAPILFIHGTLDRFVNPEFTSYAYYSCKGKKEKMIFDNAKHATSYLNNKNEYRQGVIKFIERNKN